MKRVRSVLTSLERDVFAKFSLARLFVRASFAMLAAAVDFIRVANFALSGPHRSVNRQHPLALGMCGAIIWLEFNWVGVLVLVVQIQKNI